MPEEENLAQKEKELLVGLPKRKIKDSVFTNLFREKKYLLQLYQTLHPEDKTTTENELKDITIHNVLVDTMYNDLGFCVGNRLMILVEAQSTWTMNIIVRELLYLMQSYQDYLRKTEQDLYASKKIILPIPELYVVYTGKRKNQPEWITLSNEFFNGKEIAIDVKVKMIYAKQSDDIINQYILFTRVYDEQRKKYGRTKKAVEETIRICKDRNLLKEYFEQKGKEIYNMNDWLFDEEEIWRIHIKNEVKEEKKRMVIQMLKKGKLRIEEVSELFPDLTEIDIEEIKEEIMETV